MPDYIKSGFLPNLERPFVSFTTGNKSLYSEEEFNRLIEGVSGSKITSGIIRSPSGDLKLDLDNSLLSLLEGADEVLLIGRFDDGTKGIKIKGGRGTNISLSMLELKSVSADVSPGDINTARLYVDNKGTGGRNRLMVQFVGGTPKALALQT